jgi:Zn-dependent protease
VTDLQHVLMVLFSFVIAITLHEFGHAFVADLLGDDTPRSQGRISLNPIDHLDPIGTLVIVISAFTGALFGWGKPVMVNRNNFKHPRIADSLVTFAGPLMNILLACLSALLLRMNAFHAPFDSPINNLLDVSTRLNIMLFLFNLIPVPPLDGSHILSNSLPAELAI